MGIFLRQSHNVKPPRWGSFADVQYAIRVNSEKIYDCDPDDDVLVMPLFWGLPPLDYSGYNNHGTNHGATYKDGSLDFDDNYVDCGDIDAIDTATELSGCVWVYHNNLDADHMILAKDTGLTNGFLLQRDNIGSGTGRTDIYTIWLGESGSTTIAQLEGATNATKLQTWTQVCFTAVLGSATGLRLYINGVEDANSPGNISDISAIDAGAQILRIGHHASLNRYFSGIIDEARIAKTARTADQIALFNDNKYGLYQKVGRPIWSIPAAPPVGNPHWYYEMIGRE